MKRLMAVTAMVLLLMGNAFAQDVLLTAKVKEVRIGTSKKGNEYAQIITTEQRTLQGIQYEADVFIAAFGDRVQEAKALKPGETVKLIVDKTTRKDGSVSYVVLKIVK